MRKHGKRYEKLAALMKDVKGPLPVAEAVKMVKQFATTKFDQSVECTVWLGIDPRQADQAIRGAIALPKGIGKKRTVVAFCDGDLIEQVKAAGAVEAGSDDLAKKIEGGWMDFDVALATPKMMRVVGRLGRVLGPQGKMPSPKAGTVAEDIVTAVKEYVAGKVEFRNDDGGNVPLVVGKVSFGEEDLIENINAFLSRIRRMRPSSAKGVYIKRITLSSTMGPGVPVLDAVASTVAQ
jgi:large subunit ribosomal protein L1